MIIVNCPDLTLLYPSTFFSLNHQCSLPALDLSFGLFCSQTASCLGGRWIKKAIAKVTPTIASLVPMPGGTVLPVSSFHGPMRFCFPYSRLSSVPFNFWEIWSQACLNGSAFDLLCFWAQPQGLLLRGPSLIPSPRILPTYRTQNGLEHLLWQSNPFPEILCLYTFTERYVGSTH